MTTIRIDRIAPEELPSARACYGLGDGLCGDPSRFHEIARMRSGDELQVPLCLRHARALAVKISLPLPEEPS